MHFDYTIVLAFAVAGLLFAVASPRVQGLFGRGARPPGDFDPGQVDKGPFGIVLVAGVLAAAASLLFPWALVLRHCLRDSGAAQGRGVGGSAWVGGVLFLAILSLGVAYVWRQRAPDSSGGLASDPADPDHDRES